MAKIIYFGTNGKAGHLPIGIDKDLTNEEFDTWRWCDSEPWIREVYNGARYRVVEYLGIIYTAYSVPFSVDDERNMSHTNVFWYGEHTEEEIINLIKNDSFLSKQFNLK